MARVARTGTLSGSKQAAFPDQDMLLLLPSTHIPSIALTAVHSTPTCHHLTGCPVPASALVSACPTCLQGRCLLPRHLLLLLWWWLHPEGATAECADC